jgi:hypothetical protein
VFFFKENATLDFDVYLPVFPIIDYFDMIEGTTQFSIGNQTVEEIITLYHHPILYGIGIYALLLIIIGTVGNKYHVQKPNFVEQFISIVC